MTDDNTPAAMGHAYNDLLSRESVAPAPVGLTLPDLILALMVVAFSAAWAMDLFA